MRQGAVSFLFSIVLVSAGLFLSITPCASPAPELTEDEVSKGVSLAENKAARTVLNNGLTLILKEDRRTPTFAASLFIRTGSAAEAEYTGSGIAHLIEHTIFKGTQTRDALQIEEQIKSYGGEIGAYTTFDYTAFKIEGPSPAFLPLLDIFYDIVANPKFDKDEVEKEKNVVRKEMRLIQDEPARYLSQQFWQTAYLAHPYRHPVIGYEEIFDRLTPQDLKDYYQRFYVPDNMVLVAVGDIDSTAAEKISQTFSGLSRKSLSRPLLTPEPNQLTPRYREIPYSISKSYMMLGFHSVDLASRDLYALDVLAALLGEGSSSILHQKLHNRLNLVYSIAASNYTPFEPGIFIISAAFEPGNKDKVIEQILDEIERLKKSPLKKKEMEKVKNREISSYLFSKQTQASQADDLGISQLLTGDMEFSRHYLEGVSCVTPHRIIDVAKKYLTRENMTTVMLMPSAVKEDESETISKVQKALPARRIEKKLLKNGLRVLICQDQTLPLASISICIKGGLRAEDKSNNGISNLTAHLLTKGTTSRSEEQIFSLVESLGGRLSAYSGNNSFGLSLDIMSKDLKKGLELLGNILTRPAFGRDKLKTLKEDTLAQIALINDDIFASTEKGLKEGLFPGHPYGRPSIGEADSVKEIGHRQIIDFYRSYCVGPNIVISVCGDLDPGQTYNWLASNFKGIRKKAPPGLEKIGLTPLKEAVEIRKQLDKKQAVAMIGFRSAGTDNPDRYPLQVLSSVFSGGAGRLFADIRQKKGLAYTLGTFGMTGLDTGTFIFYAATSAENIDVVKDEIIAQIKEVCEGKISPEEIASAKKILITRHQLGLQTTASFALQTALDELYELGYDNYLHYPERINSLSRQEVIQAANRYFTLGGCVISITTPKKE